MKTAPNNLSEIFEKLQDLKEIFKFGEKIVPILQSLIEFMKDVVPLLENINTSIAESTNKMPAAFNQINNVTSATEMATTEIMDRVDNITNSLGEIQKSLSNISSKSKAKTEIVLQLADFLADNSAAKELLSKFHEYDDIDPQIDKVNEKISEVNNDGYQIMLALQVQDITSQQLTAVNHLIESVNDKLASLVDDIHEANLDNEVHKLEAPEGATFDPNARFDRDENRQINVDNIIDEHKNKITSQDEIDKLFSGE